MMFMMITCRSCLQTYALTCSYVCVMCMDDFMRLHIGIACDNYMQINANDTDSETYDASSAAASF